MNDWWEVIDKVTASFGGAPGLGAAIEELVDRVAPPIKTYGVYNIETDMVLLVELNKHGYGWVHADSLHQIDSTMFGIALIEEIGVVTGEIGKADWHWDMIHLTDPGKSKLCMNDRNLFVFVLFENLFNLRIVSISGEFADGTLEFDFVNEFRIV